MAAGGHFDTECWAGNVEDVNTHRCNIVFNKTLVFLNKKHKHPKIPRGEGGLDGGLTADILFLFYKKIPVQLYRSQPANWLAQL